MVKNIQSHRDRYAKVPLYLVSPLEFVKMIFNLISSVCIFIS